MSKNNSTPTLQMVASPADKKQRVAEHLILLALGKACYKGSDSLLELLLMDLKPGEPVKITKRSLSKKAIAKSLRDTLGLVCATVEGRKFVVRDKFAERNSIPVGQNARRYELEEISTP